MKQSLSLLAFGLTAIRAQAPSSLPQCGQTCVNNMLQIAVSNFGCDANNLAACACCNANFGYGIRDCSRQVCGDGSQDYSSVVSYGSSYCACEFSATSRLATPSLTVRQPLSRAVHPALTPPAPWPLAHLEVRPVPARAVAALVPCLL